MVVRKQSSYSRLSKREIAISPVLEDTSFDGLLTAEERAELLADIEAEVHEEEIARAKDEFKAKARSAIRIQKGLDEDQITVLMDLPGHAEYIRIDNARYYHAYTYTVPASVADTLMHMMDRAWRHEEETGGANKDVYRKPRLTGLSSSGAIVNAPTAQQVAPPISPMSAGRVVPRVTTTKTLGNTQI
jgi:hypothetical protein